MSKNYIEVNLNKLYSSESPTPDKFEEYAKGILEQIGDSINPNVLLKGTAPPWLMMKISILLLPIVNNLEIWSKGQTIEITGASDKVLLTKQRRKKK